MQDLKKHQRCVKKKISKYASNGRQTVNIIQSALSLAILEGRHIIQQKI